MSSPEFSELHGINGLAVAKRCALLVSPAEQQLLYFIQGLSLLKGGCKTLAGELLKMFPDRIGSPTMHRLGMRKGQRYTGKEACEIEAELNDNGDCTAELLSHAGNAAAVFDEAWDSPRAAAPADYGPPVPWQSLYAKCLRAAAEKLPDFLTELCIDPDVPFQAPEESGGDKWGSKIVQVSYFQDIIGALFEYKQRFEERAKAEFCHTAISRQIWKQLDEALKSKIMIVLDGREGRGKTEAVRAWCNCHLGVARFLSLKGTNTKTAHFREFARAHGVGHGNSHKVSQMQANVEEVLRTSGLMQVIDEAHFFFNQAPRMKTRPEMLDYIDTAFCNPPLPLALITTPQFMICMERAVLQVRWNYRQFKRRCKRYWRLPAKNTPQDIEAVARHLLPTADKATIKQIVAYEALSKRDLSAVADVVREATLLAEEEGAKKVTFEHVRRAIHEVLLVSDVPWAEMEKRIQDKQRGRRAMPDTPPLGPEAVEECAQTHEREIAPQLSPEALNGNRLRFRGADPALAAAQDLPVLTPA